MISANVREFKTYVVYIYDVKDSNERGHKSGIVPGVLRSMCSTCVPQYLEGERSL